MLLSSDPEIGLEIMPSGGIVKVIMASNATGVWSLTRTASGATAYSLYSGDYSNLVDLEGYGKWLDYGDGLNSPLDPATPYIYRFTTSAGSASGVVTPAASISLTYPDYLRLLVRVIQAGVKSLVPPNGTFRVKPTVFVSMPITGTPPIPCISINEDLLEQDQVPIGRGIDNGVQPDHYEINELVHKRYRITVITSSTDERDFYKYAIIGLFKSILAPILLEWGQNITSRFQCTSSQNVTEPPGFYFCEIALEFTGELPLIINVTRDIFSLTDDYHTVPNGYPV